MHNSHTKRAQNRKIKALADSLRSQEVYTIRLDRRAPYVLRCVSKRATGRAASYRHRVITACHQSCRIMFVTGPTMCAQDVLVANSRQRRDRILARLHFSILSLEIINYAAVLNYYQLRGGSYDKFRDNHQVLTST